MAYVFEATSVEALRVEVVKFLEQLAENHRSNEKLYVTKHKMELARERDFVLQSAADDIRLHRPLRKGHKMHVILHNNETGIRSQLDMDTIIAKLANEMYHNTFNDGKGIKFGGSFTLSGIVYYYEVIP